MKNKVLAIAIVGVLIIAAVAGVLILTMGNIIGNEDRTGDDNDPGNETVDEGRSNIVVTFFEISKHHVMTDDEVAVTIGLRNNGTADGTYKINITLDSRVVESDDVAIGMGDSTFVSYNISSSTVGNHTVAVEDRSTYLNCYDFYAVGSYMRYHVVEVDAVYGTTEYDYTSSIMAQNETTYTANISYEGDVYPYEEYTGNKTDSSEYENLTFVGMEEVTTLYGVKTLAHFTYTFEGSGYHFEVDSYYDKEGFVPFKSVTRTEGFTATKELIDTNREWVRYL